MFYYLYVLLGAPGAPAWGEKARWPWWGRKQRSRGWVPRVGRRGLGRLAGQRGEPAGWPFFCEYLLFLRELPYPPGMTLKESLFTFRATLADTLADPSPHSMGLLNCTMEELEGEIRKACSWKPWKPVDPLISQAAEELEAAFAKLDVLLSKYRGPLAGLAPTPEETLDAFRAALLAVRQTPGPSSYLRFSRAMARLEAELEDTKDRAFAGTVARELAAAGEFMAKPFGPSH